jgi:hypothetical protein
MDFDRSSKVIVALAQEVVAMMRRIDPSWSRAFWRFESEDSRYGSNSSYEGPSGVTLIPTLGEGPAFNRLNHLGRQLWESESDPNKRFSVCLLVIDSSLNYEVKFEKSDMSKWRITKLNGASGLPAGLEVA